MSDLEEKKDESEHLCKTCPKGFETLDKLKKHEKTHDETECLCPQCGILIVGKIYFVCLMFMKCICILSNTFNSF